MQQNHPLRVVIVGAGLMGASAADRLSLLAREAGRTVQVTVLERGQEHLLAGSSAGESRISRKTSFENTEVIPAMTVRSNAALYALGAVEPSRTVILGNNPRYIDAALRAAASCGVVHSPVSDLAKSLAYVNTEGLRGLVEAPMEASGDGSGIINPRVAVRALLARAAANGAAVRFGASVRALTERGDGAIELALEGGETLLADKVIAASGVWNDRLIGAASPASLGTKAKVLKVFWFKLKPGVELGDFPNFIFKIKGGEDFAAAHPGFAAAHPGYDFRQATTEEGFYLLRDLLPDGAYLKVGHYQPTPLVKEEPDALLSRETITTEHGAFVAGFVREFFPGLTPGLERTDAPTFTRTYLESFANDAMPIIGPRSADSRVVVMTGFSGIGAKFAVEAGAYAAHYALDQPERIPEAARKLFAPDRETLRPKLPTTWRVNGRLGAPGPDGTVQSPPCLDMGLLGEKAAKLYRNGYPANAGIPEARAAVANLFNRYQTDRQMPGAPIDLEQVYLATGGATDAIQIAIDHARSKHAGSTPRALLIIPIYHLYLGQLKENGFAADYADSSDAYEAASGTLTPRTDDEILSDLRARITPETCLLFINSPRNPDGKIYTRHLLEGVLKILDDHPALRVVSDTIYKEVAPREENVTTLYGLATSAQRRRVYEIDGTSKSVAKTMDRAAWLLSDAENITEIAAVSHLKRGRPALPQMLQIVSMDEYLDASAPEYLRRNSAMYADKMRYVQAAATQVVGMHCSPHLGAYYGYLDFRAVDFGLPLTVLEKENAVVDALTVRGIGVFAGSTFKHAGTIRFNCSFKNESLRDMMAVIVDTFEGLGAQVTRRDIPLPEIDAPNYDFRPYPVGTLSTQKPR